MGGRAVPFPPNPGSFFALQLDNHGSGIEVYPAGTHLEPNGAVGGSFVKEAKGGPAYGATHCAVSVPTANAKVQDIARSAGWEVFDCNRGPFHVIEVWVENETMIEILPPDYAAEYLAFTNPEKVLTSMVNAAAQGGRQGAARQG
jgi:hypothetical protein